MCLSVWLWSSYSQVPWLFFIKFMAKVCSKVELLMVKGFWFHYTLLRNGDHISSHIEHVAWKSPTTRFHIIFHPYTPGLPWVGRWWQHRWLQTLCLHGASVRQTLETPSQCSPLRAVAVSAGSPSYLTLRSRRMLHLNGPVLRTRN